MKVLFILNTFNFFFSHRRELGEALLSRGYEVHILASGDIPAGAHDSPFKFHSYACSKPTLNPITELWSFLTIFFVMAKVRPTLVHLITLKPHLYGLLSARFLGVPVKVVALAGRGNLASGRLMGAVRNLLEFAYKAVIYRQKIGVVVQNSSDYRYVADHWRVTPQSIIRTRGSGVSLDLFARSLDQDCREPLKCVFVGRLLKAKGVRDFIEVARELSADRVQFLIAGEPDPNNSDSVGVKEIEEACNEVTNLTYLGRVEDITNLLRGDVITLFPSYYGEGIPKVLLESAAAGVPVVTTDNPGCAEAVIDGETGIVCRAGDVASYVDSVARLVEDFSLRQRLGSAARDLAEKEFGVDRVVAQHLSLYDRMLFETSNLPASVD